MIRYVYVCECVPLLVLDPSADRRDDGRAKQSREKTYILMEK